MPDSARLTTQQFLEQSAHALEAAGLFFGHGTDNAWDEACWLLETLLKRHGQHEFHLEQELDLRSSPMQEVQAMLQQRISSRRPLAYLLQEAWFCGLPFYVDERVLVPRSPIAELIANQFEPLLAGPPRRVLDLCTGGGCIGIACALAFPEAEVVLADLSPDALQVADHNVARFELGERVHCLQSDLFAGLSGSFDLIVSNPPYVGLEEYAALPQEFLEEPRLGLVSDNEGLDIPLRILREAGAWLNPQGILVLETGATWPLLDAACPQLDMLWLDFEHGGEGVCMVRRDTLLDFARR